MTGAAERLAQLRLQADRRMADLRAEVDDVIRSASSTTGDDEHDPEGATIGFERAQAQALLAAAGEQLREIDAAIARLAAGNYGICVACGRPMPAARLGARPTATRCVACAGKR